MTLRRRLERAIEGVPEGGAVTLPVAAVERWLAEADEPDRLEEDRVFTVGELSERYGRAPSTVRGWLNAGDLDGFKVKGSWRVSAKALREFESAQEDEGPALGTGPTDLSRWRQERGGTE